MQYFGFLVDIGLYHHDSWGHSRKGVKRCTNGKMVSYFRQFCV
jgi:hypothetical protein